MWQKGQSTLVVEDQTSSCVLDKVKACPRFAWHSINSYICKLDFKYCNVYFYRFMENRSIDKFCKNIFFSSLKHGTVEPRYNEDLGTMKITLLYQVSHYMRVKRQRNTKSWDQQNYLVIRGFCYIRPLYNEVPLYNTVLLIRSEGGLWLHVPVVQQQRKGLLLFGLCSAPHEGQGPLQTAVRRGRHLRVFRLLWLQVNFFSFSPMT